MDSKLHTESIPASFSDEKSFQDFEFDSCADFDDAGASNLSNNDLSFINVEDFAFQELDLDAKYRCIQAIHPNSFSANSAPVLNSMAPPSLSKPSMPSSLHSNPSQLLSKAPLPIVVKPSTRTVVVPDEPFYVAVTQFTTAHNIDTVISMIEHDLSSVMEVSYEFQNDKCRWDCVYLCGSSRCKFEFNVYKGCNGSYIVEGNRLCGDSFPFKTMFQTIRAKFTDEACSSSPKSVLNFQCIPLAGTSLELSSDDISDAVAPILSMASSGLLESQVIAAQYFCDLSLQQNMLESLCKPKCIKALVLLSRVEFDYCNQYAVCALANLSSSRSCQEVLLQDEGFLQQLLQLCSNGTYNTSEMRRECARLLANLCSAHASVVKVFQLLGQDDVTVWMDTVDDLQDERLRLHAQRAKHAFHTCLA